MYQISENYYEVIAGTSNHTHPVFVEAAKSADEHDEKGAAYMKAFLQGIEDLAHSKNGRDKRIMDSKGNIKSFSGYKNIQTVLSFLVKNLGKVEGVSDCEKLFKELESLAPQYERGYSKQVRLVMLEYESAVYILVTSLSMFMATKMDFEANGEKIQIVQKKETTHGVIEKTLKSLTEIITKPNHRKYLEELVKVSDEVAETREVNESVNFIESAVGDTLALIGAVFNNVGGIFKATRSIFRMLKDTLFGIVPLIRTCIYMKYKARADHILSLEEDADFIEKNIEQLQNRTNMSPTKKANIIKRQQAAAEAKRKKAAKLRAQLMECEKDASEDIKKHDKDIKNAPKKETTSTSSTSTSSTSSSSDDGDLVLETVRQVWG